jgi:hypothetical protein
MSVPNTQTRGDLERHLAEQLEFLKSSALAYDSGFDGEAKRLATTLRVLLHDTGRSHSLLGQLDIKDKIAFLSTVPNMPEGTTDHVRIGSHAELVGFVVGGRGRSCLPQLDDLMSDRVRGPVSFEEYWNETVIVDGARVAHSRKDIVLAVADQDGGAHIDPALNEKYASLSRGNSMGLKTGNELSGWRNVSGVELATVRQVAHEVIKTIDPHYPEQHIIKKSDSPVIGGMGFVVAKTPPRTTLPRVGRNERCPCGSGKKYKKCHGR